MRIDNKTIACLILCHTEESLAMKARGQTDWEEHLTERRGRIDIATIRGFTESTPGDSTIVYLTGESVEVMLTLEQMDYLISNRLLLFKTEYEISQGLTASGGTVKAFSLEEAQSLMERANDAFSLGRDKWKVVGIEGFDIEDAVFKKIMSL